MTINSYQPTSDSFSELAKLLFDKYSRSANFTYFINDYQKAFQFCLNNQHITFVPIAITQKQQIQAHIALIVDARLPQGEAFFGFMECLQDVSMFNTLWLQLIKEARKRGISTLKGPVNGSIWHQYRCIKESDGSDFFTSELCCEPYYYDLLISHKPKSEIIYFSAYRERFDAILEAGQKAYNTLDSVGFGIEELMRVDIKTLKTLATLSTTVFQQSWGFTALDQQEFFALYSSEKLDAYLNRIYLLYRGGRIVGFCTTLKEDNSTVIFKTICVLPEFQGLGMGNALAFKVHLDAKEQGVTKIIYALIRESNKIQYFPKKDNVMLRRYAAFDFQL